MSKINSPISKITAPMLSDIFSRKRLLTLLDKGLSRPVIWVTSPGGSGKTTLVKGWLDARRTPSIWYQVDEGDADIASFFYYMGLASKKAAPRVKKPLPLLTPEYGLGIPTFTRRWFEALYSRLKPPFIIVLDNFQDAPQTSIFHEMLYHCLESVPDGIHVIIISRAQSPEAFSRLVANNRVFTLDWKDIRLTLEEAHELMKVKGHTAISEEVLSYVHKKTDGWAAGLVLISEMSKKMDIDLHNIDGVASDQLFDYFAHEVLRLMDEETRLFLLKTSFLPSIRPETAGRLTGLKNAGRIVSRLSREHFFTTKHHQYEDTYQYHPLFKEFLMDRAEAAFGEKAIQEIQKSGAVLLEEDGQPENAVALYLKAGEYHEVSRLVLEQAPRLFAEGRSAMVREWIDGLPKDIVERTPYLLYWLGNCLMMINPVDGKKSLERAIEGFKVSGDRTGIMLSCTAAITLSIHILEDYAALDRSISELEKLLQHDSSFPSADIESLVTVGLFCAIAMRQPHRPDMAVWEKRTFDLLMRDKLDVNSAFMASVYLSVCNLWLGDFGRASIVLNKLLELSHSPNVSDLVLLAGNTTEVMHNLFMASFDPCIQMVHASLDMAGKRGMRIWDTHLMDHGAAAALSAGYMEEADRLLSLFEQNIKWARLFDKAYYYYLVAWRALLQGDLEGAFQNQKIALQLVTDSGYIFAQPVVELLMAEILHLRKDTDGAAEHLAKAYKISLGMKSKLLEYMCCLVEARILYDRRMEDEGHVLLLRAMTIGRENGYLTFMAWRPEVMTRLCRKALEAGIEVEYVSNLIRKRNLMPETPPLEVENWPWPVRISTMGGFSVEKDGIALSTTGGAQKKPFNILKALIAFGGYGVKEEELTDALWPEADGDAAHSAFTTTLSRLRKLVGEDAVIVKGGRVSLNDRICRVDILAFARLSGLTVDKATQVSDEEFLKLSDKAVSMYKGHFLPGEKTEAWALSMRERMKVKFLRLISELGEYRQRRGLWKEAVELYLKGLEIDDLSEEFYQGLMLCYRERGLIGEALSAYERCRRTLAAAFDIGPSFKTVGIYNDLKLNVPEVDH